MKTKVQGRKMETPKELVKEKGDKVKLGIAGENI
jgi:hypothetical protein